MTLLDELHAKRDLILASAKKHGIKDVRVFGSVARREERPDSDIDLLIDIEKPIKDAFGFVNFKDDVEAMTDRDVDIVFISGLYHYIKDDVLQEARPL